MIMRHDPRRDHDYWSNHRSGKATKCFRRRCNKRSRRYARAAVNAALVATFRD